MKRSSSTLPVSSTADRRHLVASLCAARRCIPVTPQLHGQLRPPKARPRRLIRLQQNPRRPSHRPSAALVLCTTVSYARPSSRRPPASTLIDAHDPLHDDPRTSGALQRPVPRPQSSPTSAASPPVRIDARRAASSPATQHHHNHNHPDCDCDRDRDRSHVLLPGPAVPQWRSKLRRPATTAELRPAPGLPGA